VAAVFLALAARAQTRIASDVEIRQMEEEARRAAGFDARVSARVNLGELRAERNESAAAQREFETALQLARDERNAARGDRDLARYAIACAWSGIALARLGRGAEAFAVLEEAVRDSGDTPGVWNLYSVAMFRLGKQEKAIGAARISVAAAERKTAAQATVRDLLELNMDRFALAQGLLDAGEDEGAQLLRTIAESLESGAFQPLRKALERREEFQIVTAPRTESGMYLALFNRSHMRLGQLYENEGLVEQARREYQAVVNRRSDEPAALAALARLASDAKERDRYLIESLDANPFAAGVVTDYEDHVASGDASPAAEDDSEGSRVRLAIQQIHRLEFRRARETLKPLLDAHPNNDVLQSLLERATLRSEDLPRPRFLDKPADLVTDPTESELLAVLSLFAGNAIAAEDRATLDRAKFSSEAAFDAADGGLFEQGTMRGVPFRFQQPARFRGVAPAARRLRIVYRILGATAADGRDALLIEPLRAEESR